jgi:hypothetical protein
MPGGLTLGGLDAKVTKSKEKFWRKKSFGEVSHFATFKTCSKRQRFMCRRSDYLSASNKLKI